MPSSSRPCSSRYSASRAALATVALTALLSLAGGAVAVAAPPAAARAAVASTAAKHGHELFHLTSAVATATRQHAQATGVLTASGHAVLGKKTGDGRVVWLVFSHGSVKLVTAQTSLSVSGPNLTTCKFTEVARGHYSIRGGRHRYAHAAGKGTYVTRVVARLKRDDGSCSSSTFSSYWESTKMTGSMSW